MTRQNLMLNLRDAPSVPDWNSSAAAPSGIQVKQAVLDCHSRSKYCLVDRCCTSPPDPSSGQLKKCWFLPRLSPVMEVLTVHCCCGRSSGASLLLLYVGKHDSKVAYFSTTPPSPAPPPSRVLCCACASVSCCPTLEDCFVLVFVHFHCKPASLSFCRFLFGSHVKRC